MKHPFSIALRSIALMGAASLALFTTAGCSLFRSHGDDAAPDPLGVGRLKQELAPRLEPQAIDRPIGRAGRRPQRPTAQGREPGRFGDDLRVQHRRVEPEHTLDRQVQA